MNKHYIFLGLLTCMIVTTAKPMARQGGFYIPDTFKVQTAFDNLSVGNICQTLTYAAGIFLFYKAMNSWSKPETSPENALTNKKAPRRYLLSGSIFLTAGLLQKYGSQILSKLPVLCSKLVSLKHRFFPS